MYREQRLVSNCRIEFERLGRRVVATSEDLSASGVFIRTDELFPVNAVVRLRIQLGEQPIEVTSRVAHLISASAARALGRGVGMGFQFLEFKEGDRDRLEAFLDLLIEETTPPPIALAGGAVVLIADPSGPLLERLSTALTDAGFAVRAVRDGNEALNAATASPPDIVLAADNMPGLDGPSLVKRLARRPELKKIPVVLMSDDPSDLVRLQAYRLGVRDFIPRPFTDEEVALRLRRIAVDLNNARAAILRGSLVEISVQTLLSLLDFERKSGILMLVRDDALARLHLSAGRVLRLDAALDGKSPAEHLFELLDWAEGSFEFTVCDVGGDDQICLSTQALLLEHARVRDEESGDQDLEGSFDESVDNAFSESVDEAFDEPFEDQTARDHAVVGDDDEFESTLDEEVKF